ncbi:MAG TPA: squalene synthase HpnC [Gaiellaceae bacterium]|nr:squalene synthase HpnC [Gaiellaceae bacterium]
MTMPVPTLPAPDAVRRRARSENFSVASVVLGQRTRRHLLAVYDFARFVDELGDAVAGDRLAALDDAEAELDRAFAGVPRSPLFRNLAHTIRECRLDREPFARLIEANRRDQRQHEYQTWDDLLSYCELSANPVGELVLGVFGAGTPERVRLSDDVCTALQVIEHVQDAREDALAGRIYLPREDREAHGVGEDELVAERASPALRALLELECERAAKLLGSGGRLVASLSGRARVAVAGYVAGGLATLDAIARVRYDVLAGPPHAGAAARAGATFRLLRSAS